MKMNELKYKSISTGLKAVSKLPLPVLYFILAPARLILEHVIGYRRKVIRKNLRNSFPDKSEKELRKIESGFYRHLMDVIAETVKLVSISDSEIDKRLRVTNPELLNQKLAEGKPVVLLLGHYGNWEFIPQISRSINGEYQFGEIYRKMHDPVWGQIFWDIRNRWKNIVQLPQKETVRTILKWNRQGPWVVGFIADQRPNSGNLHNWMTFLNQESAVSVGAETIGRHTGAEYLFIDIEKKSRGHYTLTYKEIVPDPDSKSEFPVTEKYFRMMEKMIERDPALWLWSHNRWKYKRDTGQD